MGVLEHLEPRRVFAFFEQRSAIPRGSGNTAAVSDWLAAFGRERGLEVHQDAMGNVILIQEASPGYEGAEPIILQGHMDMVCEKDPSCGKNMETEALELAVEGDTIYARGTTLGGDDGIGVAMALAVLDDPELPHPRLEAVFTVDEEIGMLGACGLDVSPLRGRRMLNLDSDEEGVFTVSCAGGNDSRCVLPVSRSPWDGTDLRLRVSNLLGGHSGAEIDRGRANACMLLGRVLYALASRTELRLVSVCGGQKSNAIPREAEAVVQVADLKTAQEVCRAMGEHFRTEYRAADPDILLTAEETAPAGRPMDGESTRRALCLLTCLPNGIQEMSHDMEGLVQTSLNLGILTTGEKGVTATFCVRSSLESQKQMLVDRLECQMTCLGGSLEVQGDYPGWAYRPESRLRDLMAEVFAEQYGYSPKIEAIHAGVECGLFAGKLAGLDCVSFGPDLEEIHTCRERMHIPSVGRTWSLLTEVLRRMR